MTEQFPDTTKMVPITPPPELLQKWATEYWGNPGESIGKGERYIATQAARWGADQELEACCEWLEDADLDDSQKVSWVNMHAARRPKPPSLKEQALEAMSRFDGEMWCSEMEADLAVIRTALEALND